MFVLAVLSCVGLVTAVSAQDPVLATPAVTHGGILGTPVEVGLAAPALVDFDGDGRVDLLLTPLVRSLEIGVRFHRRLPDRPADKRPAFAAPVFVKAQGAEILVEIG